jgi:hypothetical protein
MVESHSKLDAAFLAGRADATAERMGVVPEGTEELLRMVLSDGDCTALARLSKVLFHAAGAGNGIRVTAPVAALPLLVGNGGSNGDHARGR